MHYIYDNTDFARNLMIIGCYFGTLRLEKPLIIDNGFLWT